MRDPYLTLGVPDDADDAMIHEAFLAAIKRCPPDRNAEAYDRLRKAYAALQTRRDRLAHDLLDCEPPDPLDILDRAYPSGPPGRPALADFQALLRGER